MSAKAFASQGADWHTLAPSLEQFTRWVNRNCYPAGVALRWRIDPRRSSLLAEIAFAMVADGLPIGDAHEKVSRWLQHLPRSGAVADPPDWMEALQVDQMAENLRQSIASHHSEPQFRPSFSGCGVVESCIGDIVIGNTLVEVKAVDRRFRGLDFRQAIVYAVLADFGADVIDDIQLLNPRLGLKYTSSCQELALDLGAGSWVELRLNLREAMSGLVTSF